MISTALIDPLMASSPASIWQTDIRNAKTYNSKPTDYSVKVIIDIRDKLLHCKEWTD